MQFQIGFFYGLLRYISFIKYKIFKDWRVYFGNVLVVPPAGGIFLIFADTPHVLSLGSLIKITLHYALHVNVIFFNVKQHLLYDISPRTAMNKLSY